VYTVQVRQRRPARAMRVPAHSYMTSSSRRVLLMPISSAKIEACSTVVPFTSASHRYHTEVLPWRSPCASSREVYLHTGPMLYGSCLLMRGHVLVDSVWVPCGQGAGETRHQSSCRIRSTCSIWRTKINLKEIARGDCLSCICALAYFFLSLRLSLSSLRMPLVAQDGI